jgi:transcriptional regulator with XRE-family HTH domain
VIFHNVQEVTAVRKKRKGTKKRPAFPLKALLARLGWSQRGLARASGLDLGTVSALASGKNLPTWPTILRIATTIGADLGDLQPGKGGAA